MANILKQIKIGNTTYDIEPVTAYLPLYDLGNTTFKVTRGASQSTKNTGYWAGMLNSGQEGSPTLPSTGAWWHVISMDWTSVDSNNWISQLALPTQHGGVPHYRRNNATDTSIDSSTWHAFITDENIGSQSVSYASNAGWAKANDVYDWAKASSKPSYTKSEVGLGNVDNTADANKSVNYATSSHLLRTYGANNTSHGADYYLKCRHNVDGNDRFKLQIVRSDGSVTHSTSVDYSNSAGSVAWGGVTGKPSTYTPSSHTHTKSQITDFSHTHTKSEVGLGNVDNTADANKNVNYANSAGSVAWNNISSKPITITQRNNDSPVSGAYAYGTYVTMRNTNNWFEIYAPHMGTSSSRVYMQTGWDNDRQGWKAIAWTSDIPTSLPANGGNADTLDGKHSSDFCLSSSNITNLPINGGIYWNSYVESSSDGSDAASITVIKDGNGTNGTVLQIKQANDSNDIVNIVAGDLKLNGVSVSTNGHTHDDRYYTESEVNTKLNGKSDTGHTHSSVTDIGNSTATTFAYSKSGLNYGDYTWLAGWNGYELRAVNKSQFATAGHTHSNYVTTDNVNQTINGTKTFSQRVISDGGFGCGAGTTNITTYKSGEISRVAGTNTYNYTLPNKNGTFSMTTDLSNYLPLSGGSLTGTLNLINSNANFSFADRWYITNIEAGYRTVTLEGTTGKEAYVDITYRNGGKGSGTWYMVATASGNHSDNVSIGVSNTTNTGFRLWIRNVYAASSRKLTINWIAIKYW